MDNIITKFLNLEDDDIIVKDISTSGNAHTVTLEKKISEHYCPSCGVRMYSMGVRERRLNHPVLQDGYKIAIILRQRRWRCQNPECRMIETDRFTFAQAHKRNTTLTDLMIIDALRDPNNTAASVAERFNVSDTYVNETFARYVHMKRYPLTEVICIDEVQINLSDKCKYALVIQDFITGELIDLLPERRDRITEPYFVNIPADERRNVKYLITDMYMPYINYVQKYFPNAVSVVDSFHVVKWIYNEINNYLRKLLRKYKERDEERRKAESIRQNREVKLPLSDEVYLLQNHKWVMLRNQDNIRYDMPAHIDRHFHYLMDTYSYEAEFFRIDSSLEEIRSMKERYIRFNQKYAGNKTAAGPALDSLIEEYNSSSYEMFRQFAKLLKRYREYILNSFVMVEREKCGKQESSRLSNGPMESLNRIPKDMRRTSRGFRNHEIARNRIMFAIRKDAPILAVPKKRKDVLNHTGKKRGQYKKDK